MSRLMKWEQMSMEVEKFAVHSLWESDDNPFFFHSFFYLLDDLFWEYTPLKQTKVSKDNHLRVNY